MFGLIAYPVRAALSAVGAYILYALLTALALWFILIATPLRAVFLPSARARKSVAEAVPQPVSVSEMPVPERAPMPSPEPQPAPAVQPAQAQPAPAPVDPLTHARDILFHGDPATNYTNNLIYSRDSQFNSPRNSSVKPVAAAQQKPLQTQAETPYSAQYEQDAAHVRPAMPRRVIREEASSAPSAEEDVFNYPQTPAYRAPADLSEDHDPYANDIPVSPYSSQPSVYDEPPAPQTAPQRPVARPVYDPVSPRSAQEPPARPTYGAAPTYPPAPAQPTYERETPSPAQPSYERETPAQPTYERETPAPAQPTYERETPAPVPRDSEPSDVRFSRTEETGTSRVFDSPIGDSAAGLFDDPDEEGDDFEEEPVPALPVRGERSRGERAPRDMTAATPVPAAPAPVPEKHVYKPYVYPDVGNLTEYPNISGVSPGEIEQNSSVIVDTLAGFRVDAEVVGVTSGATVTRYDIDIPRNIAVSQVIKRDAEIAMRLHARDGVNIYSNSEKGTISIEVPNSKRSTVGLKSVMQAPEYLNSKPGALMFAVGQDVEGRNVVGNIVKMTHILVAGSTNSGKSVCLDAMLISLICKYSPEDLRLILIDPKKTEFIVFDGLPHLMINEIISDAQKAVAAFNWAIKEMERRYDLFEKKTRSGTNVRNIDEYNRALTEDEEKLPKIVIVVDELADLMSVAKKDIEERIQRLTQKARAAGIHLVLATQRPSVDVITGVIKGNLPTRMALRVISDVDSRTILDESGAQKLLGNGDMLFRTGGMFNSLRVQGAFVSSEEMQNIVRDVKEHNEAYFDTSVADFINRSESDGEGGAGGGDADDGAVDPQYIKALGIVVNLGQASISLIQRKCSVGYNHAGKIIEWMELMGYISPFDGKAKARSVLLSKEDFEAKYGDIN